MSRYCAFCKHCEAPSSQSKICQWCGEELPSLDGQWTNKRISRAELWLRIAVAATALAFLIVALICKVDAAEIPEDRAVRAIIGEASGEGYTGMLAIAGAIRNRGTLQGVYGEKAKHVDKQPRWVWDQALKAWKESANNDITSGSDHWGSVTVDAAWITTMRKGGFKEAFRYRNHIFFKRIKKG